METIIISLNGDGKRNHVSISVIATPNGGDDEHRHSEVDRYGDDNCYGAEAYHACKHVPEYRVV